MRRIMVVSLVCALAAAATALAAGSGGAKAGARSLSPQHLRLITPRVGTAVVPSDQGTTCFVSSADQSCSLTPCQGFVATSDGPDWIPLNSQCSRQQRQQPAGLVHGVLRPLAMRALARLRGR